jgi:hypothetical protein
MERHRPRSIPIKEDLLYSRHWAAPHRPTPQARLLYGLLGPLHGSASSCLWPHIGTGNENTRTTVSPEQASVCTSTDGVEYNSLAPRFRYDYSPSASRFVLRMPRLLHDQLAGSFVDDLGWQLRSIASGAGLAAAFAQQIRNTLSATIEFITPHDAKHVARSRQVFINAVEALPVAIHLLEANDVYIHIRPTSQLEPAQLNLYDLASSSRNAAYSQQSIARTPRSNMSK